MADTAPAAGDTLLDRGDTAPAGEDASSTPRDATAPLGDVSSGGDAFAVGPDAGPVGTDATPLPGDAMPIGTDVAPVSPALAFCEGAVAHRWDPLSVDEPELFPDGLLTRADPTSPTGRRLDVSPEAAPWAAQTPLVLRDALLSLNRLSGFGAMGGVLLRFTGPVSGVPATADDSLTGTGWQFWDLGGDVPVRVAFEARVLEGGLTVVLWPLMPLRLDTLHVVVVTRDARADDGACIAPAPTTRALLTGAPALPNAERLAAFAPAYRDALRRVGVEPAQVSALTVYPTHDDLAPVRFAAASVLAQPVAWGPPGACRESDGVVECEASTTVLDYRDASGSVDGTVVPTEGTIPVTWWRPAHGPGPFPVVVYGHGLDSHRDEGRFIAERVAELGIAVVAMDAVEHGDHPATAADALGQDAMRFLGLDLAHLRIDAPRLAGNFNQTNIDRLRLIGLLRQDGDPDGDGVVDLDPSRIAYLGASLGAMCGAGLLALSPDLDAAVLAVGGARLISVVTDTDAIAEYRPLINALVGSPERFDRFVSVAQHVVDAADPGTWSAHVLHDRFDGRVAPSVLASFGMNDEVVPPSAGRALARALGAPHLAPVQVPVELVPVIDADRVVGNLEGGTRTAAFFQLATVTRRGEVVPATHSDTAKSDEVTAQMRAFFGAWLAGEVPVIVRP